MDSSSVMGIRNYLKEKDFVKKVAAHVGIRPDGSRVGVLIYGDTSMVEIRMLHHRDSRSFGSLVDRLPYYSQRRRIDTALKTAKFMFKVPPQKTSSFESPCPDSEWQTDLYVQVCTVK